MAGLKGKAYYCWNTNPQPKTAKFKEVFSVQLLVDKKNKDIAESLGLEVKPATESIPGEYVKFTSYVEKPEHLNYTNVEDGRKPLTYFGKKVGYTKPIWNGSDVKVIFDLWTMKDGGNKALWKAIQVLSLAPAPEGKENYQPPSRVEDELEDVELEEEIDDSLDDF